MASRRSELRDELAAVIAAGRELSPEHDEILAALFLDRAGEMVVRPSWSSKVLSRLRQSRQLIGALCLGVACLAAGATIASHEANGPGAPDVSNAYQFATKGDIHISPVGKVPEVPVPPKGPGAPLELKPRIVPPVTGSKTGQ